jgi:23S rRNA pseudouridine1911/1915/1917 synthase
MPSDGVAPGVSLGFTPLVDHASLYDFLKELLGASGQQLKHHLPGKRQDRVRARHTLTLPLALVNHREVWPTYVGPAPRIIVEDDELVALHKPAGVHTHPQGYEATPNLVSWLVAQGRYNLAAVNPAGADRGCLYRLDGPTSGLVLYAKSTPLHQELRADFAARVRRKHYLAVVEGDVGEGTLTHTLAPFGPQGRLMRESAVGQMAHLRYRRLSARPGGTLVLIELHTGLRHQIRAQFAAAGHPLFGDLDYGGPPASQLRLHCWRYEVRVGDEWRAFEDRDAGLANDFVDLDRLLEVVLDEIGHGHRR